MILSKTYLDNWLLIQVMEKAEILIFLGTKKDEYHLETFLVGGSIKVRKVAADGDFITRSENTIKIARFVRCKNENLHAALKQKFKILDSVIDLEFLDPLFHEEDMPDVSKYTAMLSICCALYNQENVGFPVNFLQEDQKVPKAMQILRNLNHENLLQHINVENCGPWSEVSAQDFHNHFHFPQLTPTTFRQIYDVTSSIHALIKGNSVGSHIRKVEVDRLYIDEFEEYDEMLHLPPQEIKIQYKRIVDAPDEYIEKENSGILPPWPGSGTLFRIVCYPSNRSDIRNNCKMPSIFLLDDINKNPLHCSDIFKGIGAMRCYNCPSLNGSTGTCSHLGFMFMLLSAPFVLESTNRPVQLVNMKNKFAFLDPSSVTDSVLTNANAFVNQTRRSSDRRATSAIHHPAENVEVENDQSSSFQQSSANTYTRNDATNASTRSQDVLSAVNTSPTGGESPGAEGTDHQSEHGENSLNNNNAFSGVNSQVSSAQSLYGFGSTDIDGFIRREVRRNPSRRIPQQNQQRGISLLFLIGNNSCAT